VRVSGWLQVDQIDLQLDQCARQRQHTLEQAADHQTGPTDLGCESACRTVVCLMPTVILHIMEAQTVGYKWQTKCESLWKISNVCHRAARRHSVTTRHCVDVSITKITDNNNNKSIKNNTFYSPYSCSTRASQINHSLSLQSGYCFIIALPGSLLIPEGRRPQTTPQVPTKLFCLAQS